MIDVQNRTPLPGKEGRVTLALDDGTTLGGILSMADEATQEGTPWDRDTARKLQADIRTYPVAAGQSIMAGDVVDVGAASDGEAETVYKDVVAQDNVENVVFNVAVTGTDTIKLSDQYSVTALLRSSDGQAALIDNETGKQVGERTQFSASAGITSVSLARLDDSHFVVQFQIGNGLYAKIGTVSGNSITLGNDRVIDQPLSNTDRNNAILSLSQSFALSIYDSSGIQVKFLTISGNQIPTVSAAYSLPSNTGANYIPACKLPDDASGNKRVCICFSDSGDGNKGKAVIATVSGTTVTWGAPVVFNGAVTTYIKCCTDGDCVVVTYGVSGYAKYVQALTISNTNITANNPFSILASNGTDAAILKAGSAIVTLYNFAASPVSGRAVVLQRSGTSFASGEPFSFNVGNSPFISANEISDNRIIVAYADGGNSSYGTTTILEVLGNQIAGSFTNTSKDAIALTTATAGQNCEVIYSGVAALPGITVGQKITSDGVYGVGVLDGVLQVWSKDRPGQVVTGSYVGTGTYGSANPTTIELPSGLTACLVIVESQTGQVGIITPSGTSGILILYSSGIGGRLLTISNPADGVGWYYTESAEYQMNYSGRIYNYTVFLE